MSYENTHGGIPCWSRFFLQGRLATCILPGQASQEAEPHLVSNTSLYIERPPVVSGLIADQPVDLSAGIRSDPGSAQLTESWTAMEEPSRFFPRRHNLHPLVPAERASQCRRMGARRSGEGE